MREGLVTIDLILNVFTDSVVYFTRLSVRYGCTNLKF